MLVSSQNAMKGGHSFEIAVRIENLHGGNWDEIQNSAIVFVFEVCFQLFLCV